MYGDTEDITSEWIKDLQNIISCIPDLEKHKEEVKTDKKNFTKHITKKLRISFTPKQKDPVPSTQNGQKKMKNKN